MIINLRGTSGAGKSTIVKEVMSRYSDIVPLFVPDLPFEVQERQTRKRPFGYLGSSLWIPGHYEIACGGCDTIQKVDDVYASVRYYADQGYNVLFEGIMVQDDVRRAVEISKIHPLLVVSLTTPIEICLAAIQDRRDARGDTRPLDSKNTRSRAHRLTTSMLPRLKEANVEVLKLDRATALQTVLERFGLA